VHATYSVHFIVYPSMRLVWDVEKVRSRKPAGVERICYSVTPRLMQTELLKKICWAWLEHCLYPIRSGVTQHCRAASGASGGSTKLEANRHTQLASEIPEFTVRTGSSCFPCPGLVMSHANTVFSKPKACPFELNGNGTSEMHLPDSQRGHFLTISINNTAYIKDM
jgi:hypothetical protein